MLLFNGLNVWTCLFYQADVITQSGLARALGDVGLWEASWSCILEETSRNEVWIVCNKRIVVASG